MVMDGRDVGTAILPGAQVKIFLTASSAERAQRRWKEQMCIRDRDAGHIAMYDTTSAVFARADELLKLGLSVPEVTKVFLRLREWGLCVPADVYTVPYAANILRGMLEKGGAGTC